MDANVKILQFVQAEEVRRQRIEEESRRLLAEKNKVCVGALCVGVLCVGLLRVGLFCIGVLASVFCVVLLLNVHCVRV